MLKVLFYGYFNNVSLDVQYVDGTKIEAAPNRYTFVWKGSVEKNKPKLGNKTRSVLENIESAITSDSQGENPPSEAMYLDPEQLRNKIDELKPAYNVQISTGNQIIVNFSMHQRPGDNATLPPHLEQFETQQERQSKEMVADAGYGSGQNYEYAESNETDEFWAF